MNIRVNGVTISKWANLYVNTIYDSVKSTFSFDIWWDTQDENTFMRNLLLPGAYNVCTIVADNGEIVLTGVMYSPSFKSGAEDYLVNVSGCSISGVLDDIEYAAIVKDTTSTGLTFFQIACKAANPLGIYVISKTDQTSKQISENNADPDQKCSDYIASICKNIDVVLTHDEYGNLILDNPTSDKSIFTFKDGQPGIEIELVFNGECMHSVLIGKTTQEIGQEDAQPVYAYNPYCPSNGGFNYRNAAINNGRILNAPAGQLQVISEYNSANRPCIHIQSQTDSTNLQEFVNQRLAEELAAGIRVIVTMEGWVFNDKVVRPSNIISIYSPKNYLFQLTKFFVNSVELTGDAKQGTAILSCVVPEVYNGAKPENIFTANGQNNKFESNVNVDSENNIGVKPGVYPLDL